MTLTTARSAATAVVGLFCLAVAPPCFGETVPAKAFPTAEGFGAQSLGGRGGDVHLVTNVNDGGPGSLRACVDASGPRTCVFRIGGTIALDSSLAVVNPYLTIAGQTAPGSGILLRNASGNDGATLSIRTHDVIVRHLRARPGPSAASSSIDALQIIRGAHDVIIDHTSLSWAVDENLDISSYDGQDPKRVTIQWSIIAEGLDKSVHTKSKKHSKGILLSSGQTGGSGNNFTLHHNLLAHSRDRMPEIDNAGITDVVNNTLYNSKSEFGEFWSTFGDNSINFIGNYARPGPDTVKRIKEVDMKPVNYDLRIYVANNFGPKRHNGTMPEEATLDPEDRQFLIAHPLPTPPVTTTTSEEAYEDVLTLAGATVPMRDDVDTRIVAEVRSRSGRIPNHPDDVGGYPIMHSAEAPRDSDSDGMPDSWEAERGLDPNNPEDRNSDADADGYTALEEYLNALAGDD
ncbi:MAG: pectate lyase [Alphaproteobacteria bacterium]|nr:pectate lyase [Alphaproteobacteria bacterium]